MRPVYETPRDLAIEAEIADAAAKVWRADAFKQGKFDAFDFAFWREQDDYLLDGKVVRRKGVRRVLGFVEVKRRYCYSSAYPDVILSLAKAMYGIELGRATGLSVRLLIGFHDTLAHAAIEPEYLKGPITIEGRTDRCDPRDLEPCIHVPLSAFRLMQSDWKGTT